MRSRILMVEDDPKIREGILDFFSEKAPEYDVDAATAGAEGMAKIEENVFCPKKLTDILDKPCIISEKML